MQKLKQNIFFKDTNNKLGAIRLTCGILGSLAIAYLTIMLISKLLDYTIFENVVIGIILLPIFWSAFGLWIVMSKTKFYSILKTIIPFAILYIFVYIILG